MDMQANAKLARSIKRKSYMHSIKINNQKYMLCYESDYFTARLFNDDICEKIYVMSEQTFINDFLQGNIKDDKPVLNSFLRKTMDIYVANNTRAFML